MNKERRNRLSDVSNMIRDVIDEIECIMEEEEEAFDNLPESLQSSSKGDKMQDYIDNMTFRYPSLRVQLLIIAAGCALYALNLIFPSLAKAIGAVLFAFYMVYYAFIWAAAKHRPDDWDEF